MYKKLKDCVAIPTKINYTENAKYISKTSQEVQGLI